MLRCAGRAAHILARPPCIPWSSLSPLIPLSSSQHTLCKPLNHNTTIIKRFILQRSSEDNIRLQAQIEKERVRKSAKEASGECCDSIADTINKTHPECLVSFWQLTQSKESELPHLKKEKPLHYAISYNSASMVVALERLGQDINATNKELLTPLHMAAATPDVDLEIIRYLLLKGANAKLEDGNGRTPLHYAAHTGNLDAVKMLLPHSKVDTVGGQGETPLLLAAMESFTPVVDALLEHGANPKATTTEKGTALHFAAMKSNPDIIKLLLRTKVDLEAQDLEGSRPLHIACAASEKETAEKALECARLLIEKGAKVNVLDKDNLTPLHHAALKGNAELVKLLISKGADVYATTTNMFTPLAMASMSDSVETLQLLLDQGISVTTQDYLGNTPMHNAAQNGAIELVKAIIKKRALTDVRNTAGETPLLLAARGDHLEVVEALLADGADANAVDGKSVSPLHEACIHGNQEMVALLLSHRANPNEENLDSDTPLLLALKRIPVSPSIYNAIAVAVLDAGANVNHRNDHGYVALHYVAKNGLVKWVDMLLKRGANKNVKDDKGKTPYDIAKINNKPKCANLLQLENTPT